jgi:DNA-binding NtrC family response regulator
MKPTRAPSGSGPSAGPKRRVLLIDDCDELLSLMACVLLENGFEVEATNRPAEVCRLALTGRFDLLITDIFMPEMKGNTLIGMLRVSGFKAPILVVSGYVGCLEASRLRELGVAGVVPKPFRMATLLNAVHRALDPQTAEQPVAGGEPRLGLTAMP